MAAINCQNQTVFIGDNREVMLGLNSGCVENLQVLCSGCNSRKGTGTTAQLREINRRLGLMKKEN